MVDLCLSLSVDGCLSLVDRCPSLSVDLCLPLSVDCWLPLSVDRWLPLLVDRCLSVSVNRGLHYRRLPFFFFLVALRPHKPQTAYWGQEAALLSGCRDAGTGCKLRCSCDSLSQASVHPDPRRPCLGEDRTFSAFQNGHLAAPMAPNIATNETEVLRVQSSTPLHFRCRVDGAA